MTVEVTTDEEPVASRRGENATLRAALAYRARGWWPIPIPLRTKAPNYDGWPDLRLDGEELSTAFARPCGISVILGEPSGWLTDIDLDAPEVVVLADSFLPHTEAVFGRASKLRSHRLYIVEGSRTTKFHDPRRMSPEDKGMLVEIRSTGAQTVFPPSTHPSGETINWVETGEPAEVAAPDLLGAVSRLAAAALLVRHYPTPGTRHDFILALAGTLLRGGWSEEQARSLVEIVARAAGDEEARGRLGDVRTTARRLANDDMATGWPTLVKLLGEKEAQLVREWLGLQSAEPPEAPRPLRREIPLAEPYPIDAMGKVQGSVVRAMHDATQAPLAICAQSVLATACLCVQAHVNIELPTGEVKPVSEYFLTIAESGERKTAADERALSGVRRREEELNQEFRQKWRDYENDKEAFEKQRQKVLGDKQHKTRESKKTALDGLGNAPEPPPRPVLICTEPTYEGLVRLLREGHGHCGIFSSEGGMFVGGHGMTEEAKLRTISGLSELWDGNPLKRIRGGDGIAVLHGRRVALHLLLQPAVADRVFGDSLLVEQGIMSRALASMPDPAAGGRLYRDPEADAISTISGFSSRVRRILETKPPSLEDDPRSLCPCTMRLSPEARQLWVGFHDHVEALLGPGGAFAPIKPLANKAPEHAARLAATIEAFENLSAETISEERMKAGIELVEHYLAEALRIYASIRDSPDLRLAEITLDWLRNWPEEAFSPRDVYQFGPYAIRDAAKAKKILAILQEHGWIVPIESGAIVNGEKRREAFRLVPEARR